MAIQNSLFTIGTAGTNPEATYQWSATLTQSGTNFFVQVFCKYGGGNSEDNTSQTASILWGDSNPTPMVQLNPNPNIQVNGTVSVEFGATPGADFAAYFNGTMQIVAIGTAPAVQIGPSTSMLVAAMVS